MLATEEEVTKYMKAALREARDAKIIGEVPIGAVIVHDGKIIARGHNMREHSQNGMHHAEILAIQEACLVEHTWRLEDCELFVTLEPCPMCAGAMINSRIANCYWGAADPKAGAAGSIVNLLTDTRFNHQVGSIGGVMAEESAALLQEFFQGIRAKRKAAKEAAKAAAAKADAVAADDASNDDDIEEVVGQVKQTKPAPEVTGLAALALAAKAEEEREASGNAPEVQ
jgi:tRNA(adenine34) deaminase